MTDFPTLEHFLGAYLHQDWPDEYGSVWTALDDFLSEEPSSGLALLTEVDHLLLREETEQSLGRITSALGSYYAADWDGGTYRGWLEEVARRVTAALGSPPKP